MAFCSILVSCISYPRFNTKWNVLAERNKKLYLTTLHMMLIENFLITFDSCAEHGKRKCTDFLFQNMCTAFSSLARKVLVNQYAKIT
jgi:hypothetical protein